MIGTSDIIAEEKEKGLSVVNLPYLKRKSGASVAWVGK